MTGAKARQPTKGKQTGGKQGQGKTLLGRWPWFVWLIIALAIAGVVLFIRVYPVVAPSPDDSGKPRAAIVDQLYNLQENEAFIAEVTGELEDYGFEVDLYQGDDITVEFYRGLANRGHKLIVLRAHSGLVIENGEVLRKTLLFTNEEYSTGRYRLEQAFDRLGKGSAGEEYPMMFGITSKFITGNMPGEFDDTVIIMMGCSGIYLTDLAEAFVAKGASAYLAWHGSVVLHYVDEATPYLIHQLCSEGATIAGAVDSTMEAIGLDPMYWAELRYYPPESGDKTLGELLQIVVNAGDETGTLTG